MLGDRAKLAAPSTSRTSTHHWHPFGSPLSTYQSPLQPPRGALGKPAIAAVFPNFSANNRSLIPLRNIEFSTCPQPVLNRTSPTVNSGKQQEWLLIPDFHSHPHPSHHYILKKMEVRGVRYARWTIKAAAARACRRDA